MRLMDSLIDCLRRSIAQRGWFGTCQLCVVSLLWLILPRFRQTEARRRQVDAEFDRQYGVDTGGVFRPKSHEVVGGNWAFGGNYQAVDPASLLEVLSGLDLRFEDFTFIDFGSGKGRSLLLASLFPFKKIVGVEYCGELNAIARRNASRFRPVQRRCSDIEVVDQDAAAFPLPSGPLLLFLFHPFAEPVMSQVVRNVAEAYRKEPRRVVLLYFLPNLASLWEATGLFQRTQNLPAVFDTEPAFATRTKEVDASAQVFGLILMQACSGAGLVFGG